MVALEEGPVAQLEKQPWKLCHGRPQANQAHQAFSLKPRICHLFSFWFWSFGRYTLYKAYKQNSCNSLTNMSWSHNASNGSVSLAFWLGARLEPTLSTPFLSLWDNWLWWWPIHEFQVLIFFHTFWSIGSILKAWRNPFRMVLCSSCWLCGIASALP